MTDCRLLSRLHVTNRCVLAIPTYYAEGAWVYHRRWLHLLREPTC